MALIKTRARGLKLDDTFAFTGTVSGAGGGKVLQVKHASTSTAASSTSNSYADTNLSCSITPTSASSVLLVEITQNGCAVSGSNFAALKLKD